MSSPNPNERDGKSSWEPLSKANSAANPTLDGAANPEKDWPKNVEIARITSATVSRGTMTVLNCIRNSDKVNS